MKFIFSFLLISTFLSPVYAGYHAGTPRTTCTQYNNPDNQNHRSACIATPGCAWDQDDACSQCESGTASATNDISCTHCSGNDYQNIVNSQSKQHPDGAESCSDWVCATDYILIGSSCLQCSTTIPQNSHYVTDCNHWACDAGYYKTTNDNNEDICQQCPTNSTSVPGATSINQCSCDPDSYVKLLDRNGHWISSIGCILPPTQQTTGNNNAWVQSSNNSNEYVCADHATLNTTGTTPTCECPSGSEFDSTENDCSCTDLNQHFTGTTDNYTCASCPANSTWNNTECACDTGYFKSNNGNSCLTCPTPAANGSNTTLYSGDATNISACANNTYNSCGNQKNLIKTPDNNYYCGVCGIGSPLTHVNSIVTCDCASAGANNQSLENIQTSGQQCACPNGASNSNNKCVCNTSPATILNTSSNNTFSCVSCSTIVANSIFQANIQSGSTSIVYTDGFSLNSNNNACNACICDTGYYKNGNECTNCPIGLTTNPDGGATSRDDCKMTKTVKLCLVTNTNRTTSNATQCMQPIPQSAYMTDVWPNN